MRTIVRVLLTLIFLAVAGFLGYDMANYYLYSPWTRDARVRANVATVAPDISGWVDDIRVDNQFVHKGDVLFVIDQERFRLALADAEAMLAARHAQYLMLLEQYERRSKLTPGYSVTVETLDNAPTVGNSSRQLPAGDCFARHRCSEPQANRSARVSQWFHHQSQSCTGHLCLAGQAGDGPDRQRSVSGRRVFRGNQDPAHQTRRERRDLPHGRIPCAARNRLRHINGHHGPG